MLGQPLIQPDCADMGTDPRVLQSTETTTLNSSLPQQLVGRREEPHPDRSVGAERVHSLKIEARLAEFRIDGVDESPRFNGKGGLAPGIRDKLHHSEGRLEHHVFAMSKGRSIQDRLGWVAVEA